MMSDIKFCPDCGAKLVPGDRFCGDCGFDTASQTASASSQPMAERPAAAPAPPAKPQPQGTSVPKMVPQARISGEAATMGGNLPASGAKSAGSKNALIIMISLLAVLFLAGGGLYWWLSQGGDPGANTGLPAASQSQPAAPNSQTIPGSASQVDLTRASTYLSEPGLKLTFFVNYPDGTAGIVDRISGRAVPNEVVRVSEVEVGIDMGEEYGYGFHYVERPDGTYYILDNTPNEIFPVLKNNLTVGQTWNYQDASGIITWTVMDMGVDLDLGFAKFTDCLLVQEDNQVVGWKAVTYYAPGKGSVLVIAPGGATEYFKLTALQTIDPAQAAATVIKWCPNYKDIKDERTQNY